VAHPHVPAAGLAHQREALGEHVVERLALLADALAERVHPAPELLIGEPGQLLLVGGDLRDPLLVLAKLLPFADIQGFFEQSQSGRL
jgi:hypothetical protein